MPLNPLPLERKVIVVIGGTGGLGLSAAKAFVEAGAKVVAVGRDKEHANDAAQILGGAAKVMVADAADTATAPKAIELGLTAFGSFHGLYHVAGGSGRKMGDGPLHEITDEGWDYTLNLNLNSVLYSNRAAVRQLMRQGTPGSIVNLGSVLGHSPSPRYFGTHAYAATKAAVIGFSRSAAAYYAKYSIRFNVLTPALVATPMSKRAQQDPEIMKFMKTKQPLDGGRIGLPEDLDGAAIFLLSDQSSYVTGQVLDVDGGWSVSEGQHGG